MEKEFLNPVGLPVLPGFSQVVTATEGKIVFISGQVALDANNEVVGKGDLGAQVAQTFENLKRALAAVGATFDDVLKTNTYIVNYTPDMIGVVRDVRSQYLPQEKPPASTLIGVQALVLEDLLIEIEAFALLKA
ncbi:MAG: RidA family protein [Desulfurellaceae bacterium]|nr:RidA family protein [Desulfurellaceae bacterium]